MFAAASDPVAAVAVVDDDPLFRDTLAANLADAGYRVRTWDGGEAFLADVAAGVEADLLLLDWKMPGLNGIDVLRALRDRRPDLPVIFLTVLGAQIFEEAALAGGAVDFVEKSRSFTILDRRIRLILDGRRGGGAAPAAPMAQGALILDDASRRIRWRGRQVDLTLGEFAMVRVLVQAGGRDVSYRELYDAAHGEGFRAGAGEEGYRTNVRAAVKRIREKFKALDEDFDRIGNYPGFGYNWRGGDGPGG